ncbi:peptide chain release factor H [Lacinutrix jangbogonensis]|uniref:peptide chain release factor H n=1 Tax=Lacinutrix jangbogonensis TaxID=1469557 RepID=UPI00053D010C|nr:peptide chain release factor H [Lacinutrix jangbogonensis]
MGKPLIKTKIIQITSGRGPAECCWVVAQVLKLFLEALQIKDFDYKIIHREKGTENTTLQSVTVKITGTNLSLFLSQWLGTIQWVGISAYRPKHKRKNWFISINQIKSTEHILVTDKDISYQATRSSGPGGQHVNKVSSAIRATHQPTKTQVLVMDSRSQHQNKKIAKLRLIEKVNQLQEEHLKTEVKNLWENHLNINRGNPTRIFKGYDFKIQKREKTFKKQRNQLKKELRETLKTE